MKEKDNQKPKFPDGFWNIPRPEISLQEALKDVTQINWEKALKDKKIPFEMHIYNNGPHGMSLCNKETWSQRDDLVDPYAADWLRMSIHWLLECPFEKK